MIYPPHSFFSGRNSSQERTSVSSLIDKLLTLQKKDQHLSRLLREAYEIPQRKKAIEARLNAQRASLQQANDAYKQKTASLNNLEVETEASKAKIRKYRDQQFQIKSNDEYKKLEYEIKCEEQKISETEDREIGLMEDVEEAKKHMMEIERGRAVDEARVKQDQAEFDVRASELEEQVKAEREERLAMLKGIPDDVLSRYERIFKHVKDSAIVPVENGSCGGCHMNLPPQIVNNAKKMDELAYCSYCGRIVYRAD